jgi:hypothetical protein
MLHLRTTPFIKASVEDSPVFLLQYEWSGTVFRYEPERIFVPIIFGITLILGILGNGIVV